MSFPRPEVGLVISYSYLWREESEQGHIEGRKPRPCAIVLSVVATEGQAPTVAVVPVTHTAPADPGRAIEIPPSVKRHLGLDTERSWIVLDDFNVFRWPGFDLRLIAGTERFDYGFLPPRLFEQIKTKFLELLSAGAADATSRDELD